MKYSDLIERAKADKEKTKTVLQEAKSVQNLDSIFHEEHERIFKEINCLDCANCCKNHSPIILQEDMDRISDYLGISTADFISQYLEMDEEGDFVYNVQPCPFLLPDNKCRVYEVRPAACADYPHTNRKNMSEILDLTAVNAEVCPAVFRIIQHISQQVIRQ